MMNKTCSKCKLLKSTNDFYKQSRNSDGLRYDCKTCANNAVLTSKNKNPAPQKEAQKRYNKRNPNVVKNTKLKHYYGIDLSTYNILAKKQNYSCYICKTPEEKLRTALSVDHCHKTGRVRGLLCDSCNNGLGRFKDSIVFLEEAIKYLKAHSEEQCPEPKT